MTALMRYPGAKRRLLNELRKAMPPLSAVKEYVEPFVGAGSVACMVLSELPEDAEIILADADAELVCLWLSVKNNLDKLLHEIEIYEPSVESYVEFVNNSGGTDLERGFKRLVLHQTSFSGMGVMAGSPIGGFGQKSRYKIGCRWSPVTLKRNLTRVNSLLNSTKNTIMCAPFSVSLSCVTERTFVYADPPYYEKGGQLYDKKMSLSDHASLASLLKKVPGKWLLSYDDHPTIRELYQDTEITEISAWYSISENSNRPRTNELLIRGGSQCL